MPHGFPSIVLAFDFEGTIPICSCYITLIKVLSSVELFCLVPVLGYVLAVPVDIVSEPSWR